MVASDSNKYKGCLQPIYMRNKKTGIKENVPCGTCYKCLMRKRSDWSIRLQHELEFATSAAFITLTYNESHLPMNSSLSKRDFQLFMKNFRYHDGSENIRYYGIGEYGSKTYRPHYHILLFNHNHNNLVKNLLKTWTKGIHDIGTITEASIHYVSGYFHTKNDTNHCYTHEGLTAWDNFLAYPGNIPYVPRRAFLEQYRIKQLPFALMSRRPGIGAAKLLKMGETWTNDPRSTLTLKGGHKAAFPRYYANNLYSEEAKNYLREQMQNDYTDIDEVIKSKKLQTANAKELLKHVTKLKSL